MQSIIESRNKREGGYVGRSAFYNVSRGRFGRPRHRRAGSGNGFKLVTLREWSRA